MSIKEQARQLVRKPIVILDTETTGLNYAQGDEIIELAGERVEDGQVVDQFHAYLKPTRPVHPAAVAVHGLDDTFLAANGESSAAVCEKFSLFIKRSVLVGHNIRRFDYPFIASHFLRSGLTVPDNELLDTLELAREVLRLPSYKLGTIATHFNIPTTGAHRAAADVAMTRQVLEELIDRCD